ncbi:hypothetical protein NDU88_003621 [Pleurodeles waltl]|uniref:Uncharacterized protein n=1 Tax=Pleurodeles waltl TaxID=8319 RepID=A0AAV7TNY9_PLEWA|nr:hypothetical protein NDU88_003621 [Pleurodeles waltl]
MGRNRKDKPGATGSGTHKLFEPGEHRNSPDGSLASTLAEHSQRFNDILGPVQGYPETQDLRIAHSQGSPAGRS